MIKVTDIFCEIPCLTEQSRIFSGILLQKKWFKSADKRIIGQYLQKFINYNYKSFEFLGVNPYIVGTDHSSSIVFKTTEFIGAIPLRAPDTGKQIGDFFVTPRFNNINKFEEYIEILDLLGSTISPEFKASLPLISGKNFRPPLYLEAVKFINSLEKLIKNSWRKFDNVEKLNDQPYGQINWNKYYNNFNKVENRLKFPTRVNILSEYHTEYSEIKYAFEVAKNEILSSNTPIKIRSTFGSKIKLIDEKLYFHKSKKVQKIQIKNSDSPILKECKTLANNIINFNLTESTAWRVDFADVFEKFIQYIFLEASKETGGTVLTNFRFSTKTTNRFSWDLRHLEADLIYKKDRSIIFIDAKYKSNMYNKFDINEDLKSHHRHDIHQILAYCSFDNATQKTGFICYPSEKFEIKSTKYSNTINNSFNSIFILGIPLSKKSINETKKSLLEILNKIHDK